MSIASPFTRDANGDVVDSSGTILQYYPDVPEVLADLHQRGYILGVASGCPDLAGCKQLLNLFGWDKYLSYVDIHPGHKFQHLEKIKKSSGVDFSEMLFFDDDQRNVRDISSMGVVSVLVPEGGITKPVVEYGIKLFER
ncbi:unnamed protein product [Callosobruchus maculatus]|uniref:Magnesium-dependent phosphatase-1 n=2 Tax=Callosobruchus maculatus TaxID=64391 RepID=A0A653CEQ6_CALMS|nr:unnamed protein product [Callosobruchus maculatus]